MCSVAGVVRWAGDKRSIACLLVTAWTAASFAEVSFLVRNEKKGREIKSKIPCSF